MFITRDDYRIVIGEAALKTVSQFSPENIDNAEFEAVEEISSYLRPVYDVDAIFYTSRSINRLLVMYIADMALYHLTASQPQRLGHEIRKERYDRAIRWLEGVQAGRIVPDLPRAADASDGSCGPGTTFTSSPKLNHDW